MHTELSSKSLFTFNYLEAFVNEALMQSYTFIPVREFFQRKIENKTIVLRIDVDFDPFRAEKLADIFDKYGIKGSFYFRIHAKYNLLTFPVFNIINRLKNSGHELGLHTEMMDMQRICNVCPKHVLISSIIAFEKFFNYKILGTASHGDHTLDNNLDFWKTNKPEDFGLLYEAYDKRLFNSGYYVSDSHISTWKHYIEGQLQRDDQTGPLELILTKKDEINFMNLLIHPESFYKEHYHESICY